MEDFDHAHGVRSARLRYFNAAGADPTAEIGEDDDLETHLIPLVLDAATGRKSDVSVFGTDYPTPDGTVLALQHLLDNGGTIAVDLGSGHGASVRQVVDRAQRITGLKIVARNASRRAGDPPVLVADPRKASEVLGWTPQFSDLGAIINVAMAQQRFGQLPVMPTAERYGEFIADFQTSATWLGKSMTY
jgi:UDP-glucose 4-epimerase